MSQTKKYKPIEKIYVKERYPRKYNYPEIIVVKDFQNFADKHNIPLENVSLEVSTECGYYDEVDIDPIFKGWRLPTPEELAQHKSDWEAKTSAKNLPKPLDTSNKNH